MKFYLFVVSFILLCLTLNGQEITYQYYTYSQCDSTLIAGSDYYIEKDSVIFNADPITNIVNLSDTGIYVLHPTDASIEGLDPISDSISIHIYKGKNVDTLKDMCLYFAMICNWGAPRDKQHSFGWYYGKKIANGNLVEYYKNGNKRIEGKFKKGIPVGQILYYNIDGKLEKLEQYNKRGKLLKSHWYENDDLK